MWHTIVRFHECCVCVCVYLCVCVCVCVSAMYGSKHTMHEHKLYRKCHTLKGADLKGHTLKGAHLNGHTLKGAHLNGHTFKGAHHNGHTFPYKKILAYMFQIHV